jgi:hypothetical protein
VFASQEIKAHPPDPPNVAEHWRAAFARATLYARHGGHHVHNNGSACGGWCRRRIVDVCHRYRGATHKIESAGRGTMGGDSRQWHREDARC